MTRKSHLQLTGGNGTGSGKIDWFVESELTLTNIQGMNNGAKTLVRVRPRGFCAGVVRAVDIVELALEAYGRPVYVHHEIVHNRYVVDQLRRRGAIFVEAIEEVLAAKAVMQQSLFADTRIAIPNAASARAMESQWRMAIFIALALAGTALITAIVAVALTLMR